MNKLFKYSVLTIAVLVLIYFGGLIFFLDRFTFSTRLGNISLVGLTPAQAEIKIAESLNKRTLSVEENGEKLTDMRLGDLGATYDVTQVIKEAYAQEDPALWPFSLFLPNELSLTTEMVSADVETAQMTLETHGIHNGEREAAIPAKVVYNEQDGYTVEPEIIGTQIDGVLLAKNMAVALSQNKRKLAVESSYSHGDVTADGEKVQSFMKMIEQTINNSITLLVAGDEITIPAKTIESWIEFDDNNELYVNPEKVGIYLSELNEQYSTFDKVRQVETPIQGLVSVPPGILGWQIDVDQETVNIIRDVHAAVPVKREPAIYSTGGVPNQKDDIGSTYVLVDVSYQVMWLVENNQITIETPIVTGQPGAETIPGAGAIIEMLSGTNLVGYNQFYRQDYSVPVHYWLRFDHQSQGLHDASWQSAYGGDVWTYSGSLGCVNTPLAAVEYIYHHVEYGTPVLVFY